jgi:hypothetical protein
MRDTVPIEIDPPRTAVTVMRDLVRMLEYIVRLKTYTSQGPQGSAWFVLMMSIYARRRSNVLELSAGLNASW